MQQFQRVRHELFDILNNNEIRPFVRTARDIIEPYIQVVLKSEKEKFGQNKYMAKLLDWESRREPFWDSVLDGKPVVSTTETTYSATADEEDANEVPYTWDGIFFLTFVFFSSIQCTIPLPRLSSINIIASDRISESRSSVFLESINEELNNRSKSMQ